VQQGSLPQPFYLSFAVADDPGSGFVDGVFPPRFSAGYFLLRNRFGMLVEIRSWKDYPTRVRITRNAIISVLSQIAAHGNEWLKSAQEADGRAARLGGKSVALTYEASKETRSIEFRGYEYTRTFSDVSGALMTRYDESRPQIWSVPLRDDLQPALSVEAPEGGYLVPAAYAAVVGQKLEQHGVAFRVLRTPLVETDLETFRADKASFSQRSFENHQRLSLEGMWKRDTRSVRAGALFVPIAQAKARLVIALLEPQAPDALVAWGAFNNAFEKKEYMEDYVAEDVAREQLAANPGLAAEFQKKLSDDPEFAKNPAARLEFFAMRHASWDERFNLYPVMRTAVVPD
jgi:hypothetical protein